MKNCQVFTYNPEKQNQDESGIMNTVEQYYIFFKLSLNNDCDNFCEKPSI